MVSKKVGSNRSFLLMTSKQSLPFPRRSLEPPDPYASIGTKFKMQKLENSQFLYGNATQALLKYR